MYLTTVTTALWLGILTSISPCPLATNIVAVSYIGKQVTDIRLTFLFSLFYILGRTLTYMGVAVILVAGFLSIPSLSTFLQRYIIMIIGPVLILSGMFIIELLGSGIGRLNVSGLAQKYSRKGSLLGTGLMGVLFALSFCPVSAALFFGSLIPLSVSYESIILLPSLYGIGTGLPVIVFAVLIAVSTKSVGVLFKKLTVFERWARQITGVLFIFVGFYISLKYIFNL